MKLSTYLASLLPNFGKDRIIEDCRVTRGEIKDYTEPAYAIAVPLLKGWSFKSERSEKLRQVFDRNVKHASNENMIVHIGKTIPVWLANLAEIEKEIDKVYNEEVGGVGLTYRKANLLQFVEVVGFVAKYARKLLIYTYVTESETYEDSGVVFAESITPYEEQWLQANILSFCTALNIASLATQQVKHALAEIPEIVVTSENVQSMEATVGLKKLDPFQMRLIPIKLNPIYHVRMIVADWQSKRYKVAQEDLRACQMHRLQLEKLSEGKPADAKLQKELRYVESRIQGLESDIAKMEKDYA
jgi:hypothetical protein